MKQLTNIYKILSDETRLRIIILLAQNELCVCEISAILKISQPNISKNLSKLRDLDLVISERKDKFMLYKLKTGNSILIRAVNDILENIENYPQLIVDQKRNADSEKLLEQCCLRVKKKNMN